MFVNAMKVIDAHIFLFIGRLYKTGNFQGNITVWQRNPSSEKEKCMVASLPGTLSIILNLKLIFALMSPDFYTIFIF